MLISAKNISRDKSRVVELPLSKSESNRALMILHYARTLEFLNSKTLENSRVLNFKSSRILELSNSDDTILLQKHLNTINQYIQALLPEVRSLLTLDCYNAGTVFRFLMTAVSNLCLSTSASQHLSVLLTGSERMKKRPIDSLVDALRTLGVSVEYKGREGYPPILIGSTDSLISSLSNSCDTQKLSISVEQSSQFASSLLLAAPLWKNGLELHLTGNLSSLPYIDMTIDMMRQCGIDVSRDDRDITVKPGIYDVENIKVEPDWSAASFWYEMASFSDDVEVLLKNLNVNSLQADATAIKMFECLGVETFAAENGIVVRKTNANSQQPTAKCPTAFNFKDCPDLFPAVIAACAGNKMNATFTGLRNLSIKESDRKQAMMNELMKINVSFEDVSDDELKMFCPDELPYFTEENPMVFNNYEDHRIAMALSLLSMKIGTVSMENPDVVSKSYPGFFDLM